MSTAGGPRLEGIGRSGDSDIVLCMDAHDAGSYPGEPTNNILIHAANGYPGGWWGDGSNQSGLSKGAYNVYDTSLQYNSYPTVLWTPGTSLNCYLNGTADIPNTEVSTAWTFSCYIKAQDGGTLGNSGNSLSVYLYYPSSDGSSAGTVVDVGDGWYRVSRSRTGSSNYIGLAGFTGFRSEAKFYLSGAQLEKKTYPTPFVTGVLNSGEVYDGRPASVNLLMNGRPLTSPNLISEAMSKFETSSGWSLFNNFTINGVTEVAEVTNSSGTNLMQRAVSPAQVTTGERYIVTGDVTTTTGTLRTRVGNGSYAVLPTGTGSTVEVTCGATTGETVLFWADGWKGTLDNVSVRVAPSIQDFSPSKHVITPIMGASTVAEPTKFSSISLDFTSGGSSFSIPSSEDFNLGTGDFTFDFWYNPPTVETYNYLLYIGSYNALFYFYNTSTSTSGYALIHNNPTTWQYAIATGAVGGNNILAANEWQHIAFTRSGNTFRVFRNGILLATDTDSANITKDGAGIAQGKYGSDGINGYVDQYRITKGTALWTSAFTPPTRRNRSAPVVDLSGNYNGGNFATKDMTDVVTYRDGQVIEPVASAVWDFDGTDDYVNLGKVINPGATIGTNGTMCLWINPAVVDTNDYIWSNNLPASSTTYIICKFTANDYIHYRMYGSWGWGPSIYTGTISANTWTYIVCTWYTDGYAIYKDGALAASAVESGTWGGAGVAEIWLGDNDSNDTHLPFQGKMGAAALYKSSLSATQIKQNFNSQRSRFKV